MALTQLYSNLSIGIKLTIGFVLLIAIAVVIGLLGLFTINNYGDRSEVVAQASGIESALLEARTEEKNFLLRGNAEAIDKAQSFSGLAARLAVELEDRLVVPADLDRLDVIQNSSSRYSELLDELSVLISDQSEATDRIEQQMVEVARSGLKAANDLQDVQVERMAKERSQATVFIVSALVVAAVAGGLLAWLLARAIVRPIREAVEVATRVASGDLTVHVESSRTDELGQLLTALGTMVTGLRELVERINSGATNIASSAEELSTVTEQTSSGVRQQKDQTDQVATAMNEMVATVNDIARNAGDAFEAANRASEKSRIGEASVAETLSYVSRLSTEVEGTAERLRSLQADTQNIGSVLDVIKSVADQTNLLALNAAIEAARAGDSGRGFAVVADEVRNLARRTQSSATEIETLITNLVSSAESSVKTMESGTTLAGQTLDKARNTGEAIKDVATAVDEIKQYNSQIATAAEQQSSVAEDINQNVTLIRDVSDQSATSAGQVASASNELSRLGEDLKQQVSRFRVAQST